MQNSLQDKQQEKALWWEYVVGSERKGRSRVQTTGKTHGNWRPQGVRGVEEGEVYGLSQRRGIKGHGKSIKEGGWERSTAEFWREGKIYCKNCGRGGDKRGMS